MKSYDDSVKEWFIRNFGDKATSYYKKGKHDKMTWVKSSIEKVIDLSQPVTLKFTYDEGYHYSEYTNADPSFEITVEYHITGEGAFPGETLRSLELARNESWDLEAVVKAVLEISQEE